MRESDLIFIVEDDQFYADVLKSYLKTKGYSNIEVYNSGVDAIQNLYKYPSLILLDYNLGDMEGKDVLLETVAFDPNIPVIFLSGQNSIQKAIGTLKVGAYDYIPKNDETFEKLSRIMISIKKAQEKLEDSINMKKAKRNSVLIAMVIVAILFTVFIN